MHAYRYRVPINVIAPYTMNTPGRVNHDWVSKNDLVSMNVIKNASAAVSPLAMPRPLYVNDIDI